MWRELREAFVMATIARPADMIGLHRETLIMLPSE